ncbi:uncharacterized protein LOC121101292 [Ursus maritimus]|uniref:Uncharacterized protein LOC121101292 n=1 Tax=Ursus maritimus TaxID=29073 RepID=A0A8M1FAW5_URSMA|nr:uncharacterized protein LOC121101292 [Ursus maritimus]
MLFPLLCCLFSIYSALKAGAPKSCLVSSPLSNPTWFPQFPRGVTPEGQARTPAAGANSARIGLTAVTGEQAWAKTEVISDCLSPGPAWLKVSKPLGPPRQARHAAVAGQEANRGLWAALTGPGEKEEGSLRLGDSPLWLGDLKSETPASGLKACERPRSRRYRLSPAQQGPAQGPLPKGGSQSLARPSGPAPEGTVSRPPSHTAPQARPPGLRPPLTFDDAELLRKGPAVG